MLLDVGIDSIVCRPSHCKICGIVAPKYETAKGWYWRAGLVYCPNHSEDWARQKHYQPRFIPQRNYESMTVKEEVKKHILELAKKVLNNERIAVQNAEADHSRAVEKYQDLADKSMKELETYLCEL